METRRQPSTLVLEQFTPYRIVALGDAISRRLARAYADENITIPEWRVLAAIGQADRVAARDVVAKTPMDKMTVSRAVTSLERKGAVLRKADGADRRVNTLSLSDEGRALYERIAVLALDIENEVLASLSDDERQCFEGALAKLEASIKEWSRNSD